MSKFFFEFYLGIYKLLKRFPFSEIILRCFLTTFGLTDYLLDTICDLISYFFLCDVLFFIKFEIVFFFFNILEGDFLYLI